MTKIYIVGIVASGKTTFAKELSRRLEIPCYALDSIVHKRVGDERIKQSPEEQMLEIQRIDALGSWIFEGVYRDSYRDLLNMADTIVFLDPPLWKRKFRILSRYIRQKLKIEPCDYKPDLHMLRLMYKWTNGFERNRDHFSAMLHSYQGKLIVVSNPSALNEMNFLL